MNDLFRTRGKGKALAQCTRITYAMPSLELSSLHQFIINEREIKLYSTRTTERGEVR